MCGRFGFIYPEKEEWKDAIADLGADSQFVHESHEAVAKDLPRYNIAPTQAISTLVFSAKENKYKTLPMFWGWSNPFNAYGQIHNANLGRVLSPESNFWKKAFCERRCLIPASYFYDWQVVERSKARAKKQPWKIAHRKYKILFFAGLFIYQKFKNETEKSLRVAFITQHGCPLMQKINNAENGNPPGTQPVILDHHSLRAWLNPAHSTMDEVSNLIRFYEDADIEAVALQKIGDDKTHADAIPMEGVDPYAVDTPVISRLPSVAHDFRAAVNHDTA